MDADGHGAGVRPGDDARGTGRGGVARPLFPAPQLRVLFLTDGRITAGHGDIEFGLGPPIDTLTDRASVPWLDITVDFVDRDLDFRLTRDGFDINAYDQVWLYGDNPGEQAASDPATPDSVIYQPEHAPMSDAELLLLAQWMDRGGGVFATGDHSFLGASMCSRIPRVRTMRKWTHAQGVPPLDDEDRHETLQHFTGSSWDAEEGDRHPQQIFPVYHAAPGPFSPLPAAHPLLCGPHGVINQFPDHMHEGSVIEDRDVELDLPLDIPGYGHPEYPPHQVVAASLAPGLPSALDRPVPHVIAHGVTTNYGVPPRSFALVGVYDGEDAGVGRVVVDSTWHHWFSLNLRGFIAHEPVIYQQMQWYYRNIAIYLATPEQRTQMLYAAIWNGLLSVHPGAFSRGFTAWESGLRAIDVLGRNAPQCVISLLVASALPVASEPPLARAAVPVAAGPVPGPDPALVDAAIVGGIVLEMVERTNQVLLERAKGREPEVHWDEISERGRAGVARGRREPVVALGEQVRAHEAWRAALERMGQD